MKKRFTMFIQILALGLLVFSACNEDNDKPCAETNDAVITETRSVSDFHSITLTGIGNILLTQGQDQSLNIETHKEVLDRLETTVTNGVLLIELDGCINGMVQKFDINITVPDINRIEIQGLGNVGMLTDFDLDDLEIDIQGVGTITLQGTADFLDINSSGVGSVKAFNMISKQCDVALTGTGSVEVNVVDELNVTISGAGNVFYKGNPTINENITGLGELIDAN